MNTPFPRTRFLCLPALLLLVSLLLTWPLQTMAADGQAEAGAGAAVSANGTHALPSYAHVDTIRGRLAATGTGLAPNRFSTSDSVKRAACLAARLDARRKLVEVARGMGLLSETVVRDFATESDAAQADSAGFLDPIEVEEESMVEPRTCQVTVSAAVPKSVRDQLPRLINPPEPTQNIRVPMDKRPQ